MAASAMYSRTLKRGEEKRGEEKKPACRCSVGNDIIAGVKQPPFTLIYNPPPLPPILLHPPHTEGLGLTAGEGRERKRERMGIMEQKNGN